MRQLRDDGYSRIVSRFDEIPEVVHRNARMQQLRIDQPAEPAHASCQDEPGSSRLHAEASGLSDVLFSVTFDRDISCAENNCWQMGQLPSRRETNIYALVSGQGEPERKHT